MDNYIQRVPDIGSAIERGKVLVVYGARQVGKTTLVQHFLAQTQLRYRFFSGDDLRFANDFSKCDLQLIKNMLGDAELLVIDEAQRIENIGRALKLVVDHMPHVFVIATGSSSFDIANRADEPLTGRKNILTLYPVSLAELRNTLTPYEIEKKLEELLVYGAYPNVMTYETHQQKEQRILEIKNAYLIKDILEFYKIKRSNTVLDLLKLLAFQIGGEVSTVEIGRNLGVDHKTVLRYLDLLEKSFVIFSLHGFSRNLRKEITKMKKYYFVDLGIRNAVIANFNPLHLRNDTGQLWENFLMIERMKHNTYSGLFANYYFWRTYDQKEIDFIEERQGKLFGYEFKWRPHKKVSPPKEWLNTYPNASFETITQENFWEFVN